MVQGEHGLMSGDEYMTASEGGAGEESETDTQTEDGKYLDAETTPASVANADNADANHAQTPAKGRAYISCILTQPDWM
jgi:hypothetical protein